LEITSPTDQTLWLARTEVFFSSHYWTCCRNSP